MEIVIISIILGQLALVTVAFTQMRRAKSAEWREKELYEVCGQWEAASKRWEEVAKDWKQIANDAMAQTPNETRSATRKGEAQ